MTCAPRRANISATTDLPLAMPPVRPTFSNDHRRVRREHRQNFSATSPAEYRQPASIHSLPLRAGFSPYFLGALGGVITLLIVPERGRRDAIAWRELCWT